MSGPSLELSVYLVGRVNKALSLSHFYQETDVDPKRLYSFRIELSFTITLHTQFRLVSLWVRKIIIVHFDYCCHGGNSSASRFRSGYVFAPRLAHQMRKQFWLSKYIALVSVPQAIVCVSTRPPNGQNSCLGVIWFKRCLSMQRDVKPETGSERHDKHVCVCVCLSPSDKCRCVCVCVARTSQ